MRHDAVTHEKVILRDKFKEEKAGKGLHVMHVCVYWQRIPLSLIVCLFSPSSCRTRSRGSLETAVVPANRISPSSSSLADGLMKRQISVWLAMESTLQSTTASSSMSAKMGSRDVESRLACVNPVIMSGEEKCVRDTKWVGDIWKRIFASNETPNEMGTC